MRLINYLVKQSGNPKGITGKILLFFMDKAHKKIIEKVLVSVRGLDNKRVLDIGCGSGLAIQQLNKLILLA
jgi:2-polyprenyl-3-methyl-5-hydroxy-6-metoxy-1,4-benzoquinol methylase